MDQTLLGGVSKAEHAEGMVLVGTDRKGIVAVGGANVDWSCRVDAPVRLGTSNPGTLTRAFGGVARNVACNLARLGVPVALCTAVGKDSAGDALLRDCEAAHVDVALVQRLDAATGTYVATLDADGELVVAVAAMDIVERLTPECIAGLEPRLAQAELIFADANLPAESLVTLGEIAARHGVPLVLDPVSTRKAVRLRPLLAAGLPVFLLTPNRDELGILIERDVATASDFENTAEALRGQGVENVLVALGTGGAYLAGAKQRGFAACRSSEVKDVTGAGDSAIAAILWAWRRGFDLLKAAQAGQIAAALTVASHATVSPDLNEKALSEALAEMEMT
jgi:pseudouridine kinase